MRTHTLIFLVLLCLTTILAGTNGLRGLAHLELGPTIGAFGHILIGYWLCEWRIAAADRDLFMARFSSIACSILLSFEFGRQILVAFGVF